MAALKKQPAVSPLFQTVDAIVQQLWREKKDDLWGLKTQTSSVNLQNFHSRLYSEENTLVSGIFMKHQHLSKSILFFHCLWITKKY